MKRFFTQAQAVPVGTAWGVALDQKRLKTPAKTPLTLPTEALAHALAAEWAAQTTTINALTLPLTRLANSVLDQVTPQRAAVIDQIAVYAETDLLCYRALWPEELVQAQRQHWDPWLDWAARHYDAPLTPVTGIGFQPQTPESLTRLQQAIRSYDDWTLAPLYTLTTLTGSLILALALLEGACAPDTGFAAALVDETHQIAQWGEDTLATQARTNRRRDFDAALTFAQLAHT